jgi:hypothetical protein
MELPHDIEQRLEGRWLARYLRCPVTMAAIPMFMESAVSKAAAASSSKPASSATRVPWRSEEILRMKVDAASAG